MRTTIVALLVLNPVLAYAAGFEGRWAGDVHIPGREVRMVLDLAPQPTDGWSGSIVLPGFGIKGAPLSNIVVGEADVTFDLGELLSVADYGPARLKMHLDGDAMTGELLQGGNVAPVTLSRSGPAQVDVGPRSTPVARMLEDQWRGEFELGGYPRQVTITLANHPSAAATATFVIIGKRVNDLPVDLVVDEGSVVRIESRTNRVTFEGRLVEDGAALSGTIAIGSFELPVMLRRSERRPS
jgi:hypothetical protein